MPTIRLEKATKTYKWNDRKIPAAQHIDLEIAQGEFVFVVGSSGAGKSTLLKLMDGEIKPESGAVYLDDQDLTKIPKRNRPALHLSYGKVWQDSRLMRKRTIGDNLLPVVNRRTLKRGEVAEDRVTKALGLVGMPGVEERFPVELSGGECRRVELARAILNSPHILLLDELTGNLDEDNIWDILYLLGELNRQGTTVIMATHARQFVNILRKRVITMVEGRIFGDVKKGRYGDLV